MLQRWDYIERQARTGEKIEREYLFSSIYAIGARNKRESQTIVGDQITSRVVHLPEFHVLKMGQFISAIQSHSQRD